jgi:demethylmenaquinone methyltransferase/2-methoxy-6-polyprenyl-1,4-benzoquinol methylase
MKDFPLQSFYGDIHSTYDRVNRIFTFGQDKVWRSKAVAELLGRQPLSVLDLCTGTGDFILETARKAEKGAELKGLDFSPAMLEIAREKYHRLSGHETVVPVEFLEGDAGKMPFSEASFDALGITFGIRNLVYQNSRADQHLREIYRVLRPGGRLVVLESSRPENPIWRFFNTLYLRFILPYLGGLISGNLKAYQYLASSSKNYYTMGEMAGILEKAGFVLSASQSLFLGSVMLLVLEKNREEIVSLDQSRGNDED